uniref:Uncharacterized protein n=1 Tax=Anopheles darlingi TaxID=43151 RepID=A0A2M4D798_ANODA
MLFLVLLVLFFAGDTLLLLLLLVALLHQLTTISATPTSLKNQPVHQHTRARLLLRTQLLSVLRSIACVSLLVVQLHCLFLLLPFVDASAAAAAAFNGAKRVEAWRRA